MFSKGTPWPLLFSLVLNILVKSISKDNTCSSNLFHAWYMDDGVLAGPRQSLCEALNLLQVHGPALGLYVNLSKCEVFTRHNLDMFPPEMKAYVKPNIVILGVAIGDLDFCSSFIATKQMEARALLSQLEQVGLVDPRLPWSFFISVVSFVNWCTWPVQHHHHSHQRLSVFLMMTSIGRSISAWVLTPPTLLGNRPSSA